MASNITTIDGSILEGGGQILRNAAALSCIQGKPVGVNNIRAGRNNPGLRPQHLMGLELIRDICGGRLEGGAVQSTEITLHPSKINAGSHLADTRTAGSVVLLIQAALPCLLYANGESQITLRGGTNADMAPPIDYLTWVFKPMAERMGIHFDCDLVRRGFFPKGGGEIVVRAKPVKHILPITLTDRGDVVNITGLAYVAGVLPIKISHTMATEAKHILSDAYPGVPIQINAVKDSPDKAFGNGTGIILMAETSNGCRLAGTGLGKRGVPAEKVAQEAANMLLKSLASGGCVDEHLQDQLIMFMALAAGKSQLCCGPISLHTETAIHIAKSLTKASFEVKQVSRDKYMIECEGAAVINEQL